MGFWKFRNKLPTGEDIANAATKDQIIVMETWHREFYQWADSYISLLEKRIYDCVDRCKKCEYRDKEGSGCHDEVPD